MGVHVLDLGARSAAGLTSCSRHSGAKLADFRWGKTHSSPTSRSAVFIPRRRRPWRGIRPSRQRFDLTSTPLTFDAAPVEILDLDEAIKRRIDFAGKGETLFTSDTDCLRRVRMAVGGDCLVWILCLRGNPSPYLGVFGGW